jgi:pyrroline-5-carboxylate reductase
MKKQKKIDKTIGFLGAGNMAEALINGFVKSGLIKPSRITAGDVRKDRLRKIKLKYEINTASNKDVAHKSGIIFIAVKPKDVNVLLNEVGSCITQRQLVVSIAAGINTNRIEGFLKKGVPVIRTMPNTPALVGEGAIAVSKGKTVKKSHINTAKTLLGTAGLVVELPEKNINAVTALSGSGPAYVFYLAEAMEKAGRRAGLNGQVVKKLTYHTILGAGRLMLGMGLSPEELRRMVTSPKGTTEAAIKHLEENKFQKIVMDAIAKAYKRAVELNK